MLLGTDPFSTPVNNLSVRYGQHQPQTDESHEQAAAALADERERDTRQGDELGHAAHVEKGLGCNDRGEPGAQEHSVGRTGPVGDVQAARKKDQKKDCYGKKKKEPQFNLRPDE